MPLTNPEPMVFDGSRLCIEDVLAQRVALACGMSGASVGLLDQIESFYEA
jgi:hypothetical protein